MPDAPFQGLRILDVSTGIAGAFATKLLVDGGADAVVVEPPEGHRLRRHTSASSPLAATEDGVLFRYLRASTRSILAGPERALALVPHVDVVVEDYAPGHGHWGGTAPARWLAACTVNSVAARSAHGPSLPHGLTETTATPGLAASQRAGAVPPQCP